MSDIDLYGDDVLEAVNERLDKMEVPNDDFTRACACACACTCVLNFFWWEGPCT